MKRRTAKILLSSTLVILFSQLPASNVSAVPSNLSTEEVYNLLSRGGIYYSYNNLGQLDEKQTKDRVFRYSYDKNGNLLKKENRPRAITRLIQGHGYGSATQLVSDVNGDGKADSTAYFEEDGSWYVSLSNGQGFTAYSRWVLGFGTQSTALFLANVKGDGKQEAVAYVSNGSWYLLDA